uniref:E3 ubiquitin-protein ligase TRIM71-like n=1 Tax=Crassostrea virginica TaxID=6565 RepID=A0A8B8D0G7_CRAVI|nr:E3 ubiquitin-protein ligase TRIM71-like [Crassostrea virginica]
MASNVTTQGQEVVECDLCQNPVCFFCRRCGVSLCDTCVPDHLRVSSQSGHDVVDFAKKDDDDMCFCESHPKHECSAFCKTCNLPICLLCVSIKHKSHNLSELSEKIEELLTSIGQENNRLQSSRHEFERLLDHTTKQLSSLSSFYQKKKEEVTVQGDEWHKQIDNTVKTLHQELDQLKKENEARLQKQKKQLEKMIEKIDEMNKKSTRLQKAKNVTEMLKFIPVISEQKTMKEFKQYTFPTFNEYKIDENYLQTNFGFIEKMQEIKISLLGKRFTPDPGSCRKVLEMPSVSSVIETGFPTSEKNTRLYDMAVTDDQKVWMGGESRKLKLFDLQGHLHRTVPITTTGMYICMYNKHVVYSSFKAVNKISDEDTVVTMFKTGDWEPYDITGSASGDLLVCLRKDNKSKVVRYSSTGTVLQEIQYDSQGEPLYQYAWYIAENVNRDIIVTDFKKKIVIVVDRLGIFRYTYSGKDNDLDAMSVATDSVGHVFVTDFKGDKIHMLDKAGRFLRYIEPKGGIKRPRAVCMIGDGEMIVGECRTGLAKRIKLR